MTLRNFEGFKKKIVFLVLWFACFGWLAWDVSVCLEIANLVFC